MPIQNQLEKLQVDSRSNSSCADLPTSSSSSKKCSSPVKKLKTVHHFITMHAKEGGKHRYYSNSCFSQIQEVNPKSGNYIIPNFVGVRTKPCFPVSLSTPEQSNNIQALAGAAVTFKRLDTCSTVSSTQ
jgi:hypothetical protein